MNNEIIITINAYGKCNQTAVSVMYSVIRFVAQNRIKHNTNNIFLWSFHQYPINTKKTQNKSSIIA